MRGCVAFMMIACGAPAGAQLAISNASADQPSLAGFSLADHVVDQDRHILRRDMSRYTMPSVGDRYDAPKPPAKLRIRGRRIKLRVPI